MKLEVFGVDPLLVVEGQVHFNGLLHLSLELLLWDLSTSKQPGKRRDNASETFLLAVPRGSDISLSTISNEFNTLVGRIIKAFSDKL